MADIKEIDLDVEAIRSSVSNVVFSINDSEGNYSEEWLTIDCISSAFQTVNKTLNDFDSAKRVLLNHLDELDAISTEAASKASTVTTLLSQLPSNGNSPTATVSDGITSLNVRNGPGTGNSVVGYVNKGDVVTVVGKDANTGWTEVLLANGTRGYVATKYITISSSGSEVYVPENNDDESSTAKDSSLNINFGKQDSSEGEQTGTSAVPSSIVDGMPSKSDVTAFVNTQNSNLNVRKNPGTDQPISGQAIKGSTIKVLEEDTGNGWTKVELEDGTIGYVSTKYLRVNKNTSQRQDLTVDTGNNTAATPIDLDTHQSSQESGITAYVNTQSTGLNVRSGKGTDTAIKTSVAKGSSLTILEKDDGSGWTKVKLSDGTTGYVSSSYLNVPSPSETLYNGTAIVNTNTTGLNLRSSENGIIIATIPKGAEIEIGESVNGWTKAKYNGNEGYIATKWLSDIKNGDE